jgi:hypothetical protein
MKHTRVQDDRSLFDPKTLNKYPKISAWLDDPEGKYASKFSNMSVKEFKDYKMRNKDSGDGQGSKAKKVRIVDDVSGDEEIRPRKKGKARMVDSDNLDTD